MSMSINRTMLSQKSRDVTQRMEKSTASEMSLTTQNSNYSENFESVSVSMKSQTLKNKTLKLENIVKVYPNGKLAVKGLSVELYSDQIFSLLGHNGAGKTTLISIISGLIQKTSGKVRILGNDIDYDRESAKAIIGVCPQTNPFVPYLTVHENLKLYSNIKVKNQLIDHGDNKEVTEQ